MKQELQRNQLPKTSRVVKSHPVERPTFNLKSTTWAAVDAARKRLNMTASEYIEMLVYRYSN